MHTKSKLKLPTMTLNLYNNCIKILWYLVIVGDLLFLITEIPERSNIVKIICSFKWNKFNLFTQPYLYQFREFSTFIWAKFYNKTIRFYNAPSVFVVTEKSPYNSLKTDFLSMVLKALWIFAHSIIP